VKAVLGDSGERIGMDGRLCQFTTVVVVCELRRLPCLFLVPDILQLVPKTGRLSSGTSFLVQESVTGF